MRLTLIILVVGLLLSHNSFGQISEGGTPQKVILLKSASVPVIEMPILDNQMLQKSAIAELTNEVRIKPLRFAYAFDVNFTPENSGQWYKTVNNYDCWKLKIRSTGARSINIIFGDFYLPESARLFLYNEKENQILGAYTSANNKKSRKFAVSPVAGDEITIHYEVPPANKDLIPFTIKKVNHDFMGILDKSDRRPLGEPAGECNVDVNCDIADRWSDVKNAVCRMIVNGVEICTGSLINNTSEDQTPYIISAAHCYDKWNYAETSVYSFNYESPFCAPLDGDPSNSVSGAMMKAQFDSLDFALVELSEIPPPEFRPWYAGWDVSENLPDSTFSIHHPMGDIKKIALDYDRPEISDFRSNYTKNGFLKILEWDTGVTEIGSSGGPLFNMDKKMIGTLTGGVATCSNPILDYFERIALSWDYKTDSAKQLKCWLDPSGTGVKSLNGNQFYEDEEFCGAFTNLNDADVHAILKIEGSGTFSGYWGGTNNQGITEFMERFSVPGNEILSGISLGVGKIHKTVKVTNSEITIKVYNGIELPEELIYAKNVLIKDLADDAMNFIGFDDLVVPDDTFFVGFELSNMQLQDTFVVYQSLRPADAENSFYLKKDGNWQSFKDANTNASSIANIFELVACNIDDVVDSTDTIVPPRISLFPNPANDEFILNSDSNIALENVSVFNLLGQEVNTKMVKNKPYQIRINLAGNRPGIYIVRFATSDGYMSRKVSYVPW